MPQERKTQQWYPGKSREQKKRLLQSFDGGVGEARRRATQEAEERRLDSLYTHSKSFREQIDFERKADSLIEAQKRMLKKRKKK